LRYRVRFQAALVNAVAQIAPISGAFFLLVLAVGLFKGIAIEPSDWNLLVGVFGGAIVFTSLAMSVSELFDWYEVEASGLAYRVKGGVGGARLVMKKTSQATWSEIVDATPSRWLPYPYLSLRIERPSAEGATRYDSLSLPLYLRERERFLQELSSHVPERHPLRTALREASL